MSQKKKEESTLEALYDFSSLRFNYSTGFDQKRNLNRHALLWKSQQEHNIYVA